MLYGRSLIKQCSELEIGIHCTALLGFNSDDRLLDIHTEKVVVVWRRQRFENGWLTSAKREELRQAGSRLMIRWREG